MRLKIVDLFAGIGGLRKGVINGITKTGSTADVVFTSEIKPYAVKVLEANYPHDTVSGDITKISEHDIPSHDLLLAGFPCQAFSHAGARAGFNDPTRGTLFFDVARILKHHRPSYFILENVEGLITHDKDPNIKPSPAYGRTLETILQTLKNLGYKTEFALLNAAEFGVPQIRKRVFIVGSLHSNPVLPEPGEISPLKNILETNVEEQDEKVIRFSELLQQTYTLDQLQGKIIRDKRNGPTNIHSWNFHYKGATTQHEKNLLEVLALQSRRGSWAARKGLRPMEGVPLNAFEIHEFFNEVQLPELKIMLQRLTGLGYLTENNAEEYRIKSGRLSFPITHILDVNRPAPTLVATDANRLSVTTSNGLRRFTETELKRLFGFPDNFILPNDLTVSQKFDLFGNSVVVPVAEAVTYSLITGSR